MNKPISHEEKRYTNPGLAAILSFIYNGLGQLYNGQIKKGLVIITLSSTGIILTILGAILLGHYFLSKMALPFELIWGLTLLVGGIILICCVGAYSITDAYNTAKRRLSE